MGGIDLKAVLGAVGDQVKESVGRIVAAEALPQDLKDKAAGWAVAVAFNLSEAAAAKLDGDAAAYDAATKELGRFENAAKEIAVGEDLAGIAAVEAEGRARVHEAIQFGISLGTKLLLAAAV